MVQGRQLRAAQPDRVVVFKARVAPRSWLLGGTALKIGLFAGLGGIVALPATPALAACTASLPTIACGSGAGGYTSSALVSGNISVIVEPAGTVTTGINFDNKSNTANFSVHVRGPSAPLAGGTVDGGKIDGLNFITTSGHVYIETDEGTSITGGSGNHDGVRVRTDSGDVTADLSGNVKAGGSGEVLDLQSSKGGHVDVNLYSGKYTGNNTSQAIVLSSLGGHVDVHVDNDVVIEAGTSTKSHGIWIMNSSEANVDFDGTIGGAGKATAAGGDGIHIGTYSSTGSAKDADVHLGDHSHIVATNDGVHIEATGDVRFGNSGYLKGGNDGVHINTEGEVDFSNDGHLEGGKNGAYIETKGNINGWNNGYHSLIGPDNGLVATGNSFEFGNGSGLVAGLNPGTGNGFYIHDIVGSDLDGRRAVAIYNNGFWDDDGESHSGGVIFGGGTGVNIRDVAHGDVAIDNNGYIRIDDEHPDNPDNGKYSSGGLIVGVLKGVGISNVEDGNVDVNNSNTREKGQLPLGTIDSDVLGIISLAPGFDTKDNKLPGGYSEGIWSLGVGVSVDDVKGRVHVDNASGVIVGGLDAAVRLTNIDNGTHDAVDIYNGQSNESEDGGILWSLGWAADIEHITGDVNFDNGNGLTFGRSGGVRIDDVAGEVYVGNEEGGVIQSLYGDAISISGVTKYVDGDNENGGHVEVHNNGTIFAGDTAIRIDGAQTAGINNDGAIIGDGRSSNQPVIDIGNVSGEDSDGPAAFIYNNGVIASFELPGVTTHWSAPGATEDAGWAVDRDLLVSDMSALSDFVWNGGVLDVAGAGGGLADYANAANDTAIIAHDGTGSTWIENDGLLVGRVDIKGQDGGADNILYNNYSGVWLVGGSNELSGADENWIGNDGLIQTAFDKDDMESTSFTADTFYNYGVISMVDGGTGDRTTIYGDYEGGGNVALDANLKNGHLGADVMQFRDGDLSGDTGIIVRLVDKGGKHGEAVEVVNYDSSSDVSGADFYVSSNSDNYISMGGKGFVEDGLLAWYVKHDADNERFDLVADWGPGALNSAGVITAAQNVFDSGMGVVADHIYGGQFASAGGGGADLIASAPPQPIVPGGTRSAIWLKGSGDVVKRDTTVRIDSGVFDSGSTQGIFSLLGGVDFIPDDADLRVGAFGGFVGTSVDFNLPGTRVDYTGGTVGAYAAYNDGAFYADITGKADLLSGTYHFAGTSAEVTATNIGALGNVGYRIETGSVFIEPTASAQVSSTHVTGISGVAFEDATSARFGGGARVGTDVGTGNGMNAELSLLARVWDEVGGPNKAVVTSGNDTFTSTDDISGVYGELAATATVTNDAGNLSGFATVGGKVSANSSSYGAKAGLRIGF